MLDVLKNYIWTNVLIDIEQKYWSEYTISKSATSERKVGNIGFIWIAPYCTPSVIQQESLNEHNLTKNPNIFFHIKRSSTSKYVQEQNEWRFELGGGEGFDITFHVKEAFQRRNRINSQLLKNISFYRPLVASAQCILRTENLLMLA